MNARQSPPMPRAQLGLLDSHRPRARHRPSLVELVRELLSQQGFHGPLWWTVPELARALEVRGRRTTETTVSARVRELRRLGVTVERRLRTRGVHEYRAVAS